jgi:ketosteroid isomerase-like protein
MTSSEDTVRIVAVINLYAVALDSHRYDLFDRVFARDARTDFGGGAAFEGRDALVEAFKAIHAPFHATQHIISGHSVTVTGDAAFCLSYVHAYFTRRINGQLCVFDSTGWYDDRLVRQADGWRIGHRISRMVTANGDHRVMQAMPGIDVDFKLLSLGEEAEQGRIEFLKHV